MAIPDDDPRPGGHLSGEDYAALPDERRTEIARWLICNVREVGRDRTVSPGWRGLLSRLSRGWWGRRDTGGWPVIPVLDTPWQDTECAQRHGWRTRAANLGDGWHAFAVDYRTCTVCRLGWVEQPYSTPGFERRGLATAGLAALRDEQPGLSWHTLGGHFQNSQPFWAAAAADVPGGYEQLPVCPHITAG